MSQLNPDLSNLRRAGLPCYSYALSDIEKALQRKSWWAIVFILPVARRLSLIVINRTNLTPNEITIGAFVLVPVAAYFFSTGTVTGLLLGALFFEINYLFDCVDGTVARVKKLGTPLGAFLDPILDRWRIVILTIALAYGQYLITGSIEVVYLSFLYLGLNNLILFTRWAQEKSLAKIGEGSTFGVDLTRSTFDNGILAWWFRKTEDRNIMPYYHDIELDALVFVVGPLLNQVVLFLIVANVLAVLLILMLTTMFLLSLRKAQGIAKHA
jgi:phosphatidylglycerophosphate synthase